MSIIDHSPRTAAQKWEEAGASLVKTCKDYMDMCLELGTESLREGMTAVDLAAKIDSTLKTVHDVVADYQNESRAVLARTRNQLVSSIIRFPQEVLSEIFVHAVFGLTDLELSETPSMSSDVWLIYNRIYTLLSVCTTWRDTLMTRGEFWSVIPMVIGPWAEVQGSFEHSLRKTRGHKLHLAASVEPQTSSDRLNQTLAEHGFHFYAVNIHAEINIIRLAIKSLLENNPIESLSQLSIRAICPDTGAPPLSNEYIIRHQAPEEGLFADMVCNLTAFHVSGTLLNWAAVSFSTRLVEFRIDNITLGYDEMLVPFLQALSSASELRDIKIRSVVTLRPREAALGTEPPNGVTFPRLRSLFLQDLYFSTLKSLLSMITPGSHRLTLFLTEKSFQSAIYEDTGDEAREQVHFDTLCDVLQRSSADTLMLSGYSTNAWLPRGDLRRLLGALPVLTTLKIDDWPFDKTIWKDLKRMDNNQAQPFPAFRNLHFSRISLPSTKGFISMVDSHPLQKLVLGATIQIIRPEGVRYSESLRESDSLIHWLRGNVPHFRLIDSNRCPTEFYLSEWQLW